VVDTDVVSFLFKAHSLAPAYQAILAGRSLAVSLIALAGIEYGMEAKNWAPSGSYAPLSRTLYAAATGHRNRPRVGADQVRLREAGQTNLICGCLDRSRNPSPHRRFLAFTGPWRASHARMGKKKLGTAPKPRLQKSLAKIPY
jgi:hypothetical protein